MQDQTLASVTDALREPWPGTESRIMSPELAQNSLERYPLAGNDPDVRASIPLPVVGLCEE
jgi:hypothetical protein